MTNRTKAHIGVLLTNLFFAVNYSLVKMISPDLLGPFAVNVLRVGLSAVLFWIVWIFGKTGAGIRRSDAGRFILCGVTGIALNQSLFIKGLTMTSVIHVSLLLLLTPLIVTLFAVWVLKESFSLYKALGLILAIGGAVLLIMQKENAEHAPNYLLGDLFILLNAACYGAYFIMVKPLMKAYSPLHVIRWVFTFGLFLVLPIGWKEMGRVQWQAFYWQHWTALASVVFTGTFLAYYFTAYGIQHLGAAITGTYIYTQPIFAVAIATLFLHESFSWQKVLASLLIFGGVYLVSFYQRRTTASPI